MLRADVAYCPALVTFEDVAGTILEVVEGDPAYTELYAPEERDAWAAFHGRVTASWSPEEVTVWRAAIEPLKEWIRRYRERGGRILVGTDMPFGGITIHRELELLHDIGFAPLELIAIATGGAAQAMRVNDRLGTIEPGKVADLVVLAGDPSHDLRALRSIEMVLKDGRVVAGDRTGRARVGDTAAGLMDSASLF
jgi:imidazolonepropionase-like amidohydrolase